MLLDSELTTLCVADDFHSMVSRINLAGSNYMDALLRDISRECIPKAQGGLLDVENETYEFDLSHTGPFYSSDCKLAVQHATAATSRAGSSDGSMKKTYAGSVTTDNNNGDGGRDAVDDLAAAVKVVALTATEGDGLQDTRAASPAISCSKCIVEG